jgi:hypothetical protein
MCRLLAEHNYCVEMDEGRSHNILTVLLRVQVVSSCTVAALLITSCGSLIWSERVLWEDRHSSV